MRRPQRNKCADTEIEIEKEEKKTSEKKCADTENRKKK
jgi:hypothetical protein